MGIASLSGVCQAVESSRGCVAGAEYTGSLQKWRGGGSSNGGGAVLLLGGMEEKLRAPVSV